MLLEIVLFTVLTTAAALFAQEKFSVPTPISLIVIVVAASLAGYAPVPISEGEFDDIILVMLPLLIGVDAMLLRWKEIRANAAGLFYLAGIMVVLSVAMAILLNRNLLPDYHLDTAAVAALFCMIMATDPVSVSSVFGKFHLPHNLKIMAEGESLFNDASALIVFSIALTAMGFRNEHVGDDVLMYAINVVALALPVGLVVGYVGLWAMRLVHDPMGETMLVMAIAFGAFWLAEHFHASGILAVIVAVLFANSVITRRLEQGEAVIAADKGALPRKSLRQFLLNFDEAVKDTAAYQVVIGNLRFTAIIAASVLFISMAQLIHVDILLKHWNEILSVFIGVTLIRMANLGVFAFISRRTDKIPTISLHWWMILTGAGVKGAFSLLMLHMIPMNYQYRELFEAIVVGNVLLSTFLYPAFLFAVIAAYRKIFEAEYQADHLRFEE
ncbi:MAG: cation:proton antiporter [Micropepsaceae bacterium]